jgi:hypothetical protein
VRVACALAVMGGVPGVARGRELRRHFLGAARRVSRRRGSGRRLRRGRLGAGALGRRPGSAPRREKRGEEREGREAAAGWEQGGKGQRRLGQGRAATGLLGQVGRFSR